MGREEREAMSGARGTRTIVRAGCATLARLAFEAYEAGRTAVLVAASRAALAELEAYARLFCADLSLADPNPACPLWERPLVTIPQGLLVREEQMDWPRRLAALYALTTQGPHIVVASVESLVLRLPPKDFFAGASVDLAPNATFPPEELLGRLDTLGYTRVPMVTRPGEMARRGDIVDVYASGFRHPLRIEFFDDTIEELRLFDEQTQRSLQSLDEATILPASPWLRTPEVQASFSARLEKLAKSGSISSDIAYDCHKALEQGGRTLLPGSVCEHTSLLEDWLPKDTLYLCAGEEATQRAFEETWEDLAQRIQGARAQVLQSPGLVLRAKESFPWDAPRDGCRADVVWSEPLVVGVEAKGEALVERPIRDFQELFREPEARDRPWQYVSALLREWSKTRRQIILSFTSARQRQRFVKLAAQEGIVPKERYAKDQKGLFALVSPLQGGAELEWANIVILGQNVFLPKAEKSARTMTRAFQGLDSFDDLKDGELLVHRDYGIGRFRGLKSVATEGVVNDFLLLEYQGDDRLYLPVDRLDVVQRYRAGEGFAPGLSRLGSVTWGTTREKARKAVEKIAADLIEMYAFRKVAKGFHYDPPDELYAEFCASFGYEETPDQDRAIQDVLRDMSRDVPMDRLVCGDVGFGKTEVAMRAAFLAASNSRQVALLCPTTVLAEQHYQTFRARMKGFPLSIGLLSRFVSHKQQMKVLEEAASGKLDILVGTHRLLSKDVSLPNLGLLILDEEQRFGVRHKERLKEMKKNVDVLTLTATPIPRTLQLSMSGIRDLSLIETPPRERKPVATAVLERNDETLRSVLEREIAREGQIFWVYNRVQGLERVKAYVERLVPGARVAMVHGQMAEKDVDDAMRKFWHGLLDVLVCTSIIESGLDFPRANTLIVDQAQNFGLGQLYQLRGRVGRSDRQAYAYFVVPDTSHMTRIAEERLSILQDMDFLGAGFKVAMEDLRLRGAGNILGEAQTGQMAKVGLDLYLEMLEQAVDRLRGTVHERKVATEVNIGVPARIPETYIADDAERLKAYRSLTGAATGQEREALALSLRDRFGAFPEEFATFLSILDFKQFLSSLQVEKADLTLAKVRLSWADGQTAVEPARIMDFLQKTEGAQLVPTTTILVPLDRSLSYSDNLRDLRARLELLRAENPEEDKSANGSANDSGKGVEDRTEPRVLDGTARGGKAHKNAESSASHASSARARRVIPSTRKRVF